MVQNDALDFDELVGRWALQHGDQWQLVDERALIVLDGVVHDEIKAPGQQSGLGFVEALTHQTQLLDRRTDGLWNQIELFWFN